jgi:hypothetical protein
MRHLTISRAEAHSQETFQCGSCGRDFEAKIITWVDVSRTPQAKSMLLTWQFNTIQCTHCGCRSLAGTPFFYEDFEEGLLVAVFPRIPEKRGEMEKGIRQKFGYYPLLEFFYDMTQIWMLLYLQEQHRKRKNRPEAWKAGMGEERLNRTLRFLKEDPLMITIREKLTESFFSDEVNDELADILGQAVYTLEEMLPWPKDRRCLCGAELVAECRQCGSRTDLDVHTRLLSPRYSIYCSTCKDALSDATCPACGRVYTWKLGIVPTHAAQKKHGCDNSSARIHDAGYLPRS